MERMLIMGRIRNKLNQIVRKRINKHNQQRLKNHDFSLIASNCNGAFILHDLGMRFNSPFVNLWMKPEDYLKMLANLKYYMSLNPKKVFEEGINYPIGELDDVRVYFKHYSSFTEAKQKWEERKKRINYDNLYILFSDRDKCTYDDLKTFNSLPYKNKAVFTHKCYPEMESAVFIHGFENENEVGDCFEFVPNRIGKKYYDDFDYVSWFNTTRIIKNN